MTTLSLDLDALRVVTFRYDEAAMWPPSSRANPAPASALPATARGFVLLLGESPARFELARATVPG